MNAAWEAVDWLVYQYYFAWNTWGWVYIVVFQHVANVALRQTLHVLLLLALAAVSSSWHLPPPPFMTHSNKPISLSVQYGNLICLALPCIRWGTASYGLCAESSHPPAAWVLIKYWNRSYCRMTMSFLCCDHHLKCTHNTSFHDHQVSLADLTASWTEYPSLEYNVDSHELLEGIPSIFRCATLCMTGKTCRVFAYEEENARCIISSGPLKLKSSAAESIGYNNNLRLYSYPIIGRYYRYSDCEENLADWVCTMYTFQISKPNTYFFFLSKWLWLAACFNSSASVFTK